MTSLNLNIKTPCQEDFSTFSSTKRGGFCNACHKEVVDFTQMNSDEIINYFKNKATENTCGRFYNSQLTHHNIVKKRKAFSLFGGFGLAILSFFSFGAVEAQENKVDKSTNSNSPKIQDAITEKEITVKGSVITSNDGLPLPGANIILQGSATGTTTDFDGNFEFPKKLKKGDVLVFSYVGMVSQKVTITEQTTKTEVALKIDMSMCDVILMGKVATKKVYSSKNK